MLSAASLLVLTCILVAIASPWPTIATLKRHRRERLSVTVVWIGLWSVLVEMASGIVAGALPGNVLRGEMSLVGPRPEMPFLVAEYGDIQRQRLRVKPGITGLWQISADRAFLIHENIQYDLYYVEKRSLGLDLAILRMTPLALLARGRAR